MPEPTPNPDKTSLRVECICLLREFGKKPFTLIDRILGLEPGTARKTYERENKAYQSWTQKYANEALQKFYSDQITVLEVLSRTTPASIKLWQDILFDQDAKQPDKERAAKEIREWTKLFLASKDKAGVRELIPTALLEAHDEAEELGGHLMRMLGSSLDLDEDLQ
jgi:hypothetical protein